MTATWCAAGLQAVRLGLMAGIFSLDTTAFLQIMISEPLPACSLIGLVFGQPHAGVLMGAAFQLLFIAELPVGSYLPTDASLISMGALSCALVHGEITRRPADTTSLAAAAFLALAVEPLFSVSSALVRRANNRLIPAVRKRLAADRHAAALAMAQVGLALFFLRGFLLVTVFSLAGGWLIATLLPTLPVEITRAMGWCFIFLPVVGAAHFLGRLRREDFRQGSPSDIVNLVFNRGGKSS